MNANIFIFVLLEKKNPLNKKVFVVLVTYNGAHWIDKNVQSLLKSQYSVGIIAIDNNSADNSAELLSKYPEVELIQSPENLGFGKANNIGMKRALELGADYVFLLNQDAWVFEDTIGTLIRHMNHEADGIMSPKHFSGDGTTLDANFKNYFYKGRQLHTTESLFSVPFVNAAAWMLTRKCIETVGYFEPLFGHYGEDRNYCDRVRYHKLLITIDVDSKIIHDRVITRNFKKDIIQSQYKVLSALIDPNYSITKAYVMALKEVLGLPKYFSKFYGMKKAAAMAGEFMSYYLKYVFNPGPILEARKRAL
jgi:GT2 family glycosyltransferase